MNQIERAESIKRLDALHKQYSAAAATAELNIGKPNEAFLWHIANVAWYAYEAARAELKGEVQR